MGRIAIAKSEAEKQIMKVNSRKKHQLDLRRAAFVADYLLLTAPDLHRQATAFVDRLQAKYPNKRDVRKTEEFRHWQLKQLGLVRNNSVQIRNSAGAIETEGLFSSCGDEVDRHHYTNGEGVIETESMLTKDGSNQKEMETELIPTKDLLNLKEMVLEIPLMRSDTKTKETVLEIPSVPETLGDKTASIFDDIPNNIMEELMAEIRADPDLRAIMDNFNINDEVQDQAQEDLCPEWDIGLNIEIGDPLEDELNTMYAW